MVSVLCNIERITTVLLLLIVLLSPQIDAVRARASIHSNGGRIVPLPDMNPMNVHKMSTLSVSGSMYISRLCGVQFVVTRPVV